MGFSITLVIALVAGAEALSADVFLRANDKNSRLATEALMQLQKEKVWGTMQRIEDLEDWKDGGKGINSGIEMVQHTSGITKESYDAQLHEFTAAAGGSRYIAHEGNRKAADFILKTFKDAGLEAKEHAFKPKVGTNGGLSFRSMKSMMEGLNLKNGNIAGFKKGTDLADEVVVVGAHYDSVNWKDAKTGLGGIQVSGESAPGVDDNGSGMAAILLIAKALQKHNPRRSILLVAFNAEEEGLLGSKAFVQGPVRSNEYGIVKAALIADEIAFPGRDHLHRRCIFETVGSTQGTQELVDTLAQSATDSAGEVSKFEINYHGFGSDHISFLDEGIPAVLLIERDDEWRADERGHSAQDTFDDLDMHFGATMARLLLRGALHTANPPK